MFHRRPVLHVVALAVAALAATAGPAAAESSSEYVKGTISGSQLAPKEGGYEENRISGSQLAPKEPKNGPVKTKISSDMAAALEFLRIHAPTAYKQMALQLGIPVS